MSPAKASPRCRPGPSLSPSPSHSCSCRAKLEPATTTTTFNVLMNPKDFTRQGLFSHSKYLLQKEKKEQAKKREEEGWGQIGDCLSSVLIRACSRYKIKDLMKWGQRQRQINMHRAESVRKLHTHMHAQGSERERA